jgi:hypothetical protein
MLPGGDRSVGAMAFGMTGPALADCFCLSFRYGVSFMLVGLVLGWLLGTKSEGTGAMKRLSN